MTTRPQRPPSASEPDTYLTINEVCLKYSVSRRTMYRILADPDSGLRDVVIRIPPPRGPYRVAERRFEQWLQERQ